MAVATTSRATKTTSIGLYPVERSSSSRVSRPRPANASRNAQSDAFESDVICWPESSPRFATTRTARNPSTNFGNVRQRNRQPPGTPSEPSVVFGESSSVRSGVVHRVRNGGESDEGVASEFYQQCPLTCGLREREPGGGHRTRTEHGQSSPDTEDGARKTECVTDDRIDEERRRVEQQYRRGRIGDVVLLDADALGDGDDSGHPADTGPGGEQ